MPYGLPDFLVGKAHMLRRTYPHGLTYAVHITQVHILSPQDVQEMRNVVLPLE